MEGGFGFGGCLDAQGIAQFGLAPDHALADVEGEVLQLVTRFERLVGGLRREALGGQLADLAVDLGGGPDTGGCAAW